MKYFLDFDGVLCNTEALKQKLSELGLSETKRTPELLDEIHEADPHFLPSLLFPNAKTFLEERAADCFIVSSAASHDQANNMESDAEVQFQEKKIAMVLGEDIVEKIGVNKIHVIPGESKKEVLRSLQEQYRDSGEKLFFVDDREKYLLEARELGIEAIWLERSGKVQPTASHAFEGAPPPPFPRTSNFEEVTLYLDTLRDD